MANTAKIFTRLKKRFMANGPGMTLGAIAIVLALTGGAIAASGALTAKQKKEVKTIAKTEAKKFQGTGPAGSPGPAGPAGAKGDKGANGTNGINGTSGEDGKSVIVTPIDPGDPFECEENGGALVQEEGAAAGTEVCNGKEGQAGEKGEPWAPNSALPPGAIETGSWAFSATEASNPALVSISFPVSFPFNLKEAHVHFSSEPNFEDFDEAGDGTVGCKALFKNPGGSAEAGTLNPPGELCVYLGNGTEGLLNATFEGIYQLSPEATKGTARSGAVMKFSVTGGGAGHALGSWAVTGCARETPAEPGVPKCPAGS